MYLGGLGRVAAAVGALLFLLALIPPAASAETLDYDLPDGSGHFYKQANGQGGAGEHGFAITNNDGILFWNEYKRLGGPDVLGYPISRRFVLDSFWVQATQKVILQWRADTKTVAFVNVLDRLHDLGMDAWLQAYRQTPPPFDTSPDTGLTWAQVVDRHWRFLDSNAAIKARYWSDPAPLDHYGLPMSYADMGNSFVVRAQRAVFQYWKEDVPWAKKGEVSIANAGDLAKQAGLFLDQVAQPEAPASSVLTPACPNVPIRGFGAAWSANPELYYLLGCIGWPAQEMGIDVVVQRFEHGWMLWARTPVSGWSTPYSGPTIYALFDDNMTFAVFRDTWSPSTDPESTGLVPPAGRYEPTGGFGKAWREGTGALTRQRLGWAVEPMHAGRGSTQAFERGRMVWTPDPRMVVALVERTPEYAMLNTWRAYVDTYPG